MKPVFVAAAASLFIGAAPAGAVTYDLYNSFNGSASAGNFSLFEFNNLNSRIPFTVSSTCAPGFQCLLSASRDSIGFYKNVSGTSRQIFDTVTVPANTMFLHPGQTYDAGFVFVAPITSYYHVNSAFSLLTNATPTGVLVSNYKFSNNGLMTKLSDIVLSAVKRSDTARSTIFLNAGEGVGVGINDGGTQPSSYYHDATSVSFQVEPIPEPASWMLFIAGFGLTGAVLRRRPAPAAA